MVLDKYIDKYLNGDHRELRNKYLLQDIECYHEIAWLSEQMQKMDDYKREYASQIIQRCVEKHPLIICVPKLHLELYDRVYQEMKVYNKK